MSKVITNGLMVIVLRKYLRSVDFQNFPIDLKPARESLASRAPYLSNEISNQLYGYWKMVHC